MAQISIQPITDENWSEALALSVEEMQTHFVPSVAVSLATAYVKPGGMIYEPFAIVADETVVGFLNFMHPPGSFGWSFLCGFLIGKEHQRQGYGRAALLQFQQWAVKRYPLCRLVYLSLSQQNEVARRLYLSVGFELTDRIVDEEPVYCWKSPEI